MNSDSSLETIKHIKSVADKLMTFSCELLRRAQIHDKSKLVSPEKELFDEFTPLLKGVVFGSDEYKEFMVGLKPALDNHYAKNSHHPEHYPNGIDGFDLFDLVEMYCDWKAATERNIDGDILKSIEYGKGRFKMSDQLVSIFTNTAINGKI